MTQSNTAGVSVVADLPPDQRVAIIQGHWLTLVTDPRLTPKHRADLNRIAFDVSDVLVRIALDHSKTEMDRE